MQEDPFLDQLKVSLKRFDPACIAILFGSRARGDFLAGSDYDVIVVSEKFRGLPFQRRAAMVMKALGRLAEKVELLCYTPEEFERKKEEISLVERAVKEGRRLLP